MNDHSKPTAQNTEKNARIGIFLLGRLKIPSFVMLDLKAIIFGASLFGFVILLIGWDRLKPEVTRLIISGASRSLLLECMSSPSQTGNLAGLLSRKYIGGDTVGAVGFTIGSVVAVVLFSDCCSIGLGSGIDTLSP